MIRLGVRRVSFLARLGDVIVAYALGIALRNLFPFFWTEDILRKVSELVVPPALILMLARSSPRSLLQGGPGLLTAWAFQVISVVICACAAFFIWGAQREQAEIGALAVSVYTGGILNLALLAQTLHLPPENFGQINLADIAAGALYLFVIMNLGRFVFRHQEDAGAPDLQAAVSALSGSGRFGHIWPLPVAFLTLAAAYAISWLAGMEGDPRLILILITLLGLLLSAWPALKHNPAAAVQSEFLITLFSFSMGLTANLRVFTAGVLPALFFLLTVLGPSVALHFGLCRLFRLPDGLFVATSAGGIMSPPFVPGICQAARYQSWIPFGVAAGLAGNSLGTLLGLAFYEWLGRVAV